MLELHLADASTASSSRYKKYKKQFKIDLLDDWWTTLRALINTNALVLWLSTTWLSCSVHDLLSGDIGVCIYSVLAQY